MNLDAYTNKKLELQKACNEKIHKLATKYAQQHNTVKIGDNITDHYQTIQVESISTHFTDEPSCIYQGQLFTKAGKPFKNAKKSSVYQINIKNHISI